MIDTCRSKAAFTRDDQRECFQFAPQTITCNGKPSVVVVSAEEWLKKITRRGSFAEFLSASPLCGAEMDSERQHDEPRYLSL
ncbi:type II toxin-antitoxin system prevent-host-death family antitoxin [Agrobacterium tumefaciens]|uniref:type II toxin-antitoxin system prevent-host-death family antitoxin n=1 Tax=Agrobacterium tumefaciens TaxID=358 RepID=UPI001230116B|nr:type II toxin-antitoxin system prevent-host-death family antitoxin [Agrobacterium tumefaciens]